MMSDPNPNPHLHIQGECKECGFVYALAYGFDCPKCGKVAFRRVSRPPQWPPPERYEPMRRGSTAAQAYWRGEADLKRAVPPLATYGPELSPYPHVLNNEGTACRWDCDACEWVKRERPAIVELDKMYALEDKR